MNNPFSYQNDLTGFRSQISANINKHDNIVAQAQSRAVSRKNALIQRAKDVKASGEELVKQGLEGAAIPHAGKAIYKGGKAVYRALTGNQTAAGQQSGNSQLDSNNTDSLNSTSRGGPTDGTEDQQVDTGDGVEMTGRGGPVEGTASEPGANAFGEIDENTLTQSSPFTRNISRGSDITGRVGEAEQEASNNAEQLAQQTSQQAEDAVSNLQSTAQEGENAVNDALSSGRNAVDNAISGVGEDLQATADGISEGLSNAVSGGLEDLASSGGSALDGVTGAVTGGIEDGVGAGISALAEATGATSWIPFIGEVMGGVTAAAALGAAGYGLYEEIKGGDEVDQAEQAKLNVPQAPKLNVAGSFIAPQQTSVQI